MTRWTRARRWVIATVAAALLASSLSTSGNAASDEALPRFEECPSVGIAGEPPVVDGGCVFVAPAVPVRFRVMTAAGPMRFETCLTQMFAQVGGDGTFGFEAFGILDTGNGACGDILPCRWPGADPDQTYDLRPKLPWPGSIEASGPDSYRIVTEACINTCLGRFKGKIEFQLRRTARGWRLDVADSVGETGLRLDAEWQAQRIPRP